MDLSRLIKEEAFRLGFDACGFAPVAIADTEAPYLDRWLADGCHAGMQYMENYREIRLNPVGLVEGARTVISVALNYFPAEKQPADAPRVAYYAYGKDYHKVVKKKLQALWQYITGSLLPSSAQSQVTARCFTDSAPVLERYWAWRAGLGWIGKNSCLIIPGKGSYFFLGEIVTTLELEYDSPQENRCGTCTRCLDACPTGALERPLRLNAAKCLSYLTIEHKGEIPAGQASRLDNRLYGCDTCQEVCPWNRFATPTCVDDFRPTPDFLSLRKEDLKNFSPTDYKRIFAQSAAKRAGYEGFVRTIKSLNSLPPDLH